MKHLWILPVIILLGIAFGISLGAIAQEDNKFENMVNASVLIYNDYNHGSGVFIKDNVILTAAHCLEGVDTLQIEFNDGTILKSSDFYIDEKKDIGFIFVEATELHIAKVSAFPGELGDTVYLVGSPYYLELKFTLTKGILSHLDRDANVWKDTLQTDAEAAPGNSGSPLYNEAGNVIGVCVGGPVAGGGVTLCESGESILEAYQRYKDAQ